MTWFNPDAIKTITAWNEHLTQKIALTAAITGHPEDTQFDAVAKALVDLCPNLDISIQNQKENQEMDLPGFIIRPNLIFHALPGGRELTPFLEALSSSDKAQADPVMIQTCMSLQIPVNLTLFIAMECPHCPVMVKTTARLAALSPFIHVRVIDGTLFSDAAQKLGVMSAPTLILDEDFRWTGQVSAEEVLKLVTDRDPSQLSPTTLKNILERGDATWITSQMILTGSIFQSFVSLLLSDTWSVRLGALVVVEELAEAAPKLASQLSPMLMDGFDTLGIPVKGDVVYTLGQVGDEKTRDWLIEKMKHFEHEDLKEAAQEAIFTIDHNLKSRDDFSGEVVC